ncbi:ABC transporter substrate-binding protein [Acaricomes phytoseiuli]|nr:ABC transporter substrate-binding protein [Acaricomes phytoseiuli]MCW1250375.1 ABC transporter substrate-binding protein [Acaricomes phytoseiuli]
MAAYSSVTDPEFATQNLEGRGPITFVSGKDNNDIIRPLLERWNEARPDEQVTFKEQTDQADQQRSDLVRNFQAQNSDYDVVNVDVVWTAEFAARGWIQPLEGPLAVDTTGVIPATIDAASYQGKLFAAPRFTDGALLYYRKDLVPEPPTTWDQMMAMCPIAKENGIGCYAGQLANYEGLTVNASEAINSTGGRILDQNGNLSLDTPEAKAGLQALATAYQDGNIPVQAVTYQEEQSRQAFQSGQLMFLRNWPYVFSLVSKEGSSEVAGKFGVTSIPGQDGPGASTLGGSSSAISVFSENKATARDFVEFMMSEDSGRFMAMGGSLAPVRESLYSDPELVAQMPYLPDLRTALDSAVPRPVTPFYPAVTKAVQTNAYAAIRGEKTVEQAIQDMKLSMEAAGVK